MRTCTRCGVERPLTDYSARSRTDRRPDSWCRPCRRAQRQEWGERNAERLRASGIARRAAARLEAFAAYGGPSCACCGEHRVPFLVLDHVDGGGTAHRQSLGHAGRGHSFYAWLRREGFPPGFRVLCANCNGALGLYGSCPHDDERAAAGHHEP